jgi:DNA polymerase III delta subunit
MLADLLRDGLPPGHVLVLVESAVADSHPLVKSLAERGAVVEAGELTVEKGKFSGLRELAAELRRETAVGIESDALEALARRTLRTEESFGSFGPRDVDARSTARFAAEYRKLAGLLGGAGTIEHELVTANVVDRGEEDAFALSDAISAGKPAEALARLARRIAGAEDPLQERLLIFGSLASLCRQIVAVRGLSAIRRIPLTETNYRRFESGLFPRFVGEDDGVAANPLKSTRSAYPVFKAYLAAARLPGAAIDRLPGLVLETERRLKGESGEPDAALAELVLAVARPA